MPKYNGVDVTPEQLLTYIRVNLGSFIDKNVAEFRPYSIEDRGKWQSPNPMNTVVTFDIKDKNFGNIDDASVMVTNFSSRGWMFSTVQNPDDNQHPVSGNRFFGYKSNNDGSYTFFAIGADRLTGYLDNRFGDPLAFLQANKLWESFQLNIVNFVNKNGGKATALPSFSIQPTWKHVKRIF